MAKTKLKYLEDFALLEGKKFRGGFLYDHPSSPDYQSVILEKMLEEVLEV